MPNYNANINFLSSVREGKKSSSSIIGLVERDKAGELRVAVSELDPIRQPVQSGRLDGLHPIHDRFISNRGSLSQDELEWVLPWHGPWW